MGAFQSGALTVLITLNHLYPMSGAKTRSSAFLPVRGISFTAVVGHLEAHVLLGNHNATIVYSIILKYRNDSD